MQPETKERPSWDRVIRVAEQIRLMGVGRTQFYELAKNPKFPPEILLGKRARGRWLSEMITHIDSCKHQFPVTKDKKRETSDVNCPFQRLSNEALK